ncbi:MAG: methylthioribulose 1-phosphate dehydratase [Candidatus Melainabacteria bacterium]|nr:methylthioribulose 1-phosphate dehydratase [Candidatus Melainabacteria bacterium]
MPTCIAPDYARAVQEIIQVGQFLDARGWAPATSGNYSVRLSDGHIAITTSGGSKGELTPAEVMTITREGEPVHITATHTVHQTAPRASAETLLHTGIYQQFPDAGAVLHVHFVAGVVLTRLLPEAETLVFENHEMLKAFPGVSTHQTEIRLPVFDNTQDMPCLAQAVRKRLLQEANPCAYFIRNHGLYAWGRHMAEARRIVEAVAFLTACELEMRRLSQ